MTPLASNFDTYLFNIDKLQPNKFMEDGSFWSSLKINYLYKQRNEWLKEERLGSVKITKRRLILFIFPFYLGNNIYQ